MPADSFAAAATTEWVSTLTQSGLLVCAAIAVARWFQVSRWKQVEAAAELQRSLAADPDCRLARMMIEYQETDRTLSLSYEPGSGTPPVTIRYDAKKREAALSKKVRNLSAEESAIRHIFDVFIDRMELVMLRYDDRSFRRRDLLYFKQWLDLLVQHECEDIIMYAEKSRSSRVAPFISSYAKTHKPYLERRTASQ